MELKEGMYLADEQVAEAAKEARKSAGVSKAQASRDFGVAWASIHQAEEEPGRSLYELRIRMLKRYAGLTLEGPMYRVVQADSQEEAA